jgi:hypothetical protein
MGTPIEAGIDFWLLSFAGGGHDDLRATGLEELTLQFRGRRERREPVRFHQ